MSKKVIKLDVLAIDFLVDRLVRACELLEEADILHDGTCAEQGEFNRKRKEILDDVRGVIVDAD